MADDETRLPYTEWSPEGWVRNPPADARQLAAANQWWAMPDPQPNLTWRDTRPFWVGVLVGAVIPFIIGLAVLVYLLVIR
jgi:hypothetical protein